MVYLTGKLATKLTNSFWPKITPLFIACCLVFENYHSLLCIYQLIPVLLRVGQPKCKQILDLSSRIHHQEPNKRTDLGSKCIGEKCTQKKIQYLSVLYIFVLLSLRLTAMQDMYRGLGANLVLPSVLHLISQRQNTAMYLLYFLRQYFHPCILH